MGLSQQVPLMSGPKEKRKEKHNRGILGPKVNATLRVCSVSTGGTTRLIWSCFSYGKQPEMNVSEGLNCSHEGCGWLTGRGKLTTEATGVLRGRCSGRFPVPEPRVFGIFLKCANISCTCEDLHS